MNDTEDLDEKVDLALRLEINDPAELRTLLEGQREVARRHYRREVKLVDDVNRLERHIAGLQAEHAEDLTTLRSDLAHALRWDPDVLPADAAALHQIVGGVRMLRDLAGPTELTIESESPDLFDLTPPVADRKAHAVETIDEGFRVAGIDRTAKCGYRWAGSTTDGCDMGAHECRLIDPLHLMDHACDPDYCGQTLSIPMAEAIEVEKEAKRNAASAG